jgi:hypothetical protein
VFLAVYPSLFSLEMPLSFHSCLVCVMTIQKDACFVIAYDTFGISDELGVAAES